MQRSHYLLLIFLFLSFESIAQNNLSCTTATPLILGNSCQSEFLPDSLNNALPDFCTEMEDNALWYSYQANFSGTLLVETSALFNDVLSVFEGTCADLIFVNCRNWDEYGFEGETMHLLVTSDTKYWFQLSSLKGNYGVHTDSFCIQINQVTNVPIPPTNDICDNATILNVGGPCLNISNENAGTSAVLPANEPHARSDIWLKFTATATALVLSMKENFSSILTVYEGDCTNLTEKMSTPSGRLLLDDLTIGTEYFVQVSGNFATIEGSACIELNSINPAINEECINAIPIALNDNCLSFSNENMTMSSEFPSCEFYPAADIWYSFVAPISHGIKLRTEADFLHSIAIYEGNCNELEEKFCQTNPQSCEGYTIVENLMSGQTYFLQIMSQGTSFGHLEGTGCLEILDITQGGNFTPLDLKIDVFCLSVDAAELNITTTGGEGTVLLQGNQNGDILATNSEYLVKATDAKGCVKVQKGIVDCINEGECEVSYYLQTQPVSCAGNSDGTASISTSGSNALTFAWSNGDTAPSISGLSAGIHNLTITNADTCSFEILFTIGTPTALTASVDIREVTDADLTDGSITLSPSGGHPPYQYEWANGSTGAILTDLVVGDYTFTITDNQGCTYTDTVSVMLDPTCSENRVLTLDIPANTMKVFAADDFINSTVVIADQADVIYKAGTRIQLKTGFRAIEGAKFRAKIEDCSEPCDGVIDACGICNGSGETTWYLDADEDGLGNADTSITSCTQPAGYVMDNTDICDNGVIWEEIAPLFADNGCTGCHGGGAIGGLDLRSYPTIAAGGNKCGPNILTGTTLVDIITTSGYSGCGTALNGSSMNSRVGGQMDAEELAKIQAWIDGGTSEFCNDDCSEDIIDIPTITQTNYHAADKINSTATINTSTGAVTFKAGNEINLLSGFHAQGTVEFLATIEDCAAAVTEQEISYARISTLPNVPQNMELKIFPNPTYNQTTIQFELAKSKTVDLLVIDQMGKLVTPLISKAYREAGLHTISYEMEHLESGLYWVQLLMDDAVISKKIVLVRD